MSFYTNRELDQLGFLSIGTNVLVSRKASIYGAGRIALGANSRIDDYSREYMTNPTIPTEYTKVDSRSVKLGRHVIVGSGSVILPGVTIGESTAVGALSLVTKNLDPHCIFAGSPLKWIKDRVKDLLNLKRNSWLARFSENNLATLQRSCVF